MRATDLASEAPTANSPCCAGSVLHQATNPSVEWPGKDLRPANTAERTRSADCRADGLNTETSSGSALTLGCIEDVLFVAACSVETVGLNCLTAAAMVFREVVEGPAGGIARQQVARARPFGERVGSTGIVEERPRGRT